MKKIIAFVVFICVACSAFCQYTKETPLPKHYISIAGGHISSTPVITLFVEIAEAVGNSINGYTSEANIEFGNYSLNYHYTISKCFAIGAKVIVQGNREKLYSKDEYHILHSENYDFFYSLMPSARLLYKNTDYLQLYSGLDLGVALYHSVDKYADVIKEDYVNNNIIPAFNLTVFGVNYGQKFFFNSELNIGMDALLKVGFGVRL
ncbi:MAG: hypothetical protein HUK18_01130 [Bacteroidales bacterium]|nr:hypothetical protein [Bacteroidales bacterium]